MNISKVNIDDLISPSWNPRTLSNREKEKLKKSIDEYGYINPVIVNKVNNHIVGGNQRVSVLRELGYSEVDVVFINEPNLDREKALNLSLNKVSGEWDTNKLEDLLVDLEVNEVDLDLTGFDLLDLEEFDFNIKFSKSSDNNPILDEVIIEDEGNVSQATDNNDEEDDFKVSVDNFDKDDDLFNSIEYSTDTVTVFGEEEDAPLNEEETSTKENKGSNVLDKVYEQKDVTSYGKDEVNKVLKEEYKVLLTFNNKDFFEDTVKKLKLEDTGKYSIRIL